MALKTFLMVGTKIRLGRVSGNTGTFFFGLILLLVKGKMPVK